MSQISIARATSFAYGFLFRRFWAVLRLAWLPLLLAGVILYFSLSIYANQLSAFAQAPNQKIAGFALGVITAGLVATLFLYTVAIFAITQSAFDRPLKEGWAHFRAGRGEWRLFAAYLRFALLVLLLVVCVSILAAAMTTMFEPGSTTSLGALYWFSILFVTAGLFWLIVRVGFLLAPVAAAEKGAVVRRAYRLSARYQWRLALLVSLLMIPGIGVQAAGEFLLRSWGAIPLLGVGSIADHAATMQHLLPGLLVVTSAAYLIGGALMAIGSVHVYRALAVGDVQKVP